MSDSPEVQLQLKKRARRRLVGAVAVAGLAAVILPMVMDEEPKQQIQDVQIRIPGQNETPFKPQVAVSEKRSAPAVEAAPAHADRAADAAEKPLEKAVDKQAEKAAERRPEEKAEHKNEKPAEKPVDKPAEKAADKSAEKAAEKATEKAAEKAHAKSGEGKAASGNGQYLILIGAFANPANVKQLQSKIGELGIKVITEPLDLPDGKRTRVRAGPFASREAADKALEKIKRIGVNGVVAAKQ